MWQANGVKSPKTNGNNAIVSAYLDPASGGTQRHCKAKALLFHVFLACEMKVARIRRNSSQIISGRPLQVDTNNRYRGLGILTTIFSEFTQKRSCFLQPKSTVSINEFKELKHGTVVFFIVLLFFCFLAFNFIFNIGVSF